MHNNLVQAKFLIEKAQTLWEPYREVSNGLVVGLLQDAAELVLWAICKKYQVQIDDPGGFVKMLNILKSEGKEVKGRPQMMELNRARVSYKHFGICPTSSDVGRFIGFAGTFLQDNVTEHLGLDFETVSLADGVANDSLRGFLKEAERCREEGDLKEATIQASLGFQRLCELALGTEFREISDLRDAYRLFPEESQQEARYVMLSVERVLHRLVIGHVMGVLGADRVLFEEIRLRCFTVNVSETGKRLGVCFEPKTEVTLENVNFLISHITEIACRLRPASGA